MRSLILILIALVFPAACDAGDGRGGYREIASASPCGPGADPIEVAVRAYTGDCAAVTAAQRRLEVAAALHDDLRVVVLTWRDLDGDSIRDERVRYELARVPGSELWQIVWAGWQHRCWPDRGREYFNTASCS